MTNSKLKIICAVTVGSIATVVFITAITIAADLYPPLKDWLKNVFTHHWIGKGILSVVVFAAFGVLRFILPVEADEEKIGKALKILFWLLILGILAILGFFVWEALLK